MSKIPEHYMFKVTECEWLGAAALCRVIRLFRVIYRLAGSLSYQNPASSVLISPVDRQSISLFFRVYSIAEVLLHY